MSVFANVVVISVLPLAVLGVFLPGRSRCWYGIT